MEALLSRFARFIQARPDLVGDKSDWARSNPKHVAPFNPEATKTTDRPWGAALPGRIYHVDIEATNQPDPRLRSLDPLVGEWDLHHRDFESGETWGGRDRFEWMDGGFFLAFEHEEFGRGIAGTMIVGFERRWGAEDFGDLIVGHWFESSTGNHFVYFWEVDDDTVRFALEEPGSVFRFEGTFSDDRKTIEGVWHVPEGGNDYALTMTRAG